MTYYVMIERQGWEELVVKVDAKTKEEAKVKAMKVFMANYDVSASTKKPSSPDCPVVNGDGEEIDLDEESDEIN